MKKIALCFMLYDKIQCEYLWEEWLCTNIERVSIIVHSKLPIQIQSQLLKRCVCQIPTIPTNWGDFSLVEATLLLYKEAIKDENVEYCILLSGSCIPVKSFDYVYETLLSSNGKSISNVMGSGKLGLGDSIIPIVKKLISKHEQWIILNRKHCEYVLKNSSRLRFIFKRNGCHPPDELWFNTLMKVDRLDKEIIYKKTTLTTWPKQRINHPKTYESISDEELNTILKGEFLFARKFLINSFTESQISQIVYNNQNNLKVSQE